jgi:hypothetical protein
MPPDERLHPPGPDDPADAPTGPGGPATAPDGGPLNRRPGAGETTWIVELRRLRTGITDLGSRVEGLAGRVEEFTGHHNDLAAVVSEQIAPELAALRQFAIEELNRQGGQLDEVLTTLRREDNAPVNWPALTAAQARVQWPILAQWIAEVLVPWYEITATSCPTAGPCTAPRSSSCPGCAAPTSRPTYARLRPAWRGSGTCAGARPSSNASAR